MFPRNENRNEGTFACSLGTKTGGTFAKTTLLRNRPFVSKRVVMCVCVCVCVSGWCFILFFFGVRVSRFVRRDSCQSNLSGDTFSIEAPQNLLRTKQYSKNITSGKEFPFESGNKLLRTFFWCLYRKGVAIHAYLIIVKRSRSK